MVVPQGYVYKVSVTCAFNAYAMNSLVAILYKDTRFPIPKVDLLSTDDSNCEHGITATIVPSLLTNSLTDPVTSLDLGHNLLNLLLIPGVYIPYFSAHLTILSLHNNQLESVPSAIWQLTSLVDLDLNHNKLSYISPFLVGLKHLRSLDLSHNSLSFLPLQFPPLLEILDVSHNLLHSAPSVLLEIPFLCRLWIDNNQFARSLNFITLFPAGPHSIRQPEENTRVTEKVVSLRDLAIQALARQLQQLGIHSYCRHETKCSDIGPLLSSTCPPGYEISHVSILKQAIGVLFRDGPAGRAFLTKDDLLYLVDDLDVDPYRGHDNFASIAANISHFPPSEVDVQFAEIVHRKVIAQARLVLANAQESSVPTSSLAFPALNTTSASGLKGPTPDKGTKNPGLVIDVPLSFAQANDLPYENPLSPIIMDWATKLPPPTPKSRPSPRTPSHQPPPTPSLPIPPSAFSTYCLFTIVPISLLISLVVPVGICGVCGQGIYRTPPLTNDHGCGMLKLTAIQMCKGNLVPVTWTLCSVTCWRIARDKASRPIRMN